MSKLKKRSVSNVETGGVIKCDRCKKTDRIMAWEKFTQADCNTREKRRAYVSLSSERAYKKVAGNTLYYRCPNCSEYIEGYRLRPIYDKEDLE